MTPYLIPMMPYVDQIDMFAGYVEKSIKFRHINQFLAMLLALFLGNFMSIKIGSHQIHRMGYGEIQPGDLVCTYEALSTRPDLGLIRSMLNVANLFRKPELCKMFHTEVVGQTYPRPGMCKIVHADGGTRKVEIQNDSFKDHHPGQALLIFRAKDKDLQREIAAVANKTGEPNSGHKCKTLLLDSLIFRIRCMFDWFLFDNFGKKAPDRTLRNIAEMMVNYEETGRFYGPDGSGSQEMRCVEYTANIVNVAALRILLQDSLKALPHKAKIEAVYERLKDLNRDGDLPLKLSSSQGTPSGFVDFFLKNSNRFQVVGYLGAIADPIQGPPLDVKGEGCLFSPDLIPSLFKDAPAINQMHVARVLKALGILDDSWRIYPKAAADWAKIQTIEAYLKCRMVDDFKISAAKIPDSLPPIGSLSTEERKRVLFLEKEFIKTARIERTEKTLKLSLNVFANQEVEIDKIRSMASRMLNTVFLSPISFILNRLALYKERLCEKGRFEILSVHEKIRKNGKMDLVSSEIAKGHRPWLHYSLDGGKTWDVEPFKKEKERWETNFQIPKGSDLHYRLFIGPENLEDPDPVGKAESWQQTEDPKGVFVRSQDTRSISLSNPMWGELAPLPLNDKVFFYREKCNEIAPLAQLPASIQEYENHYAALENRLDLFKPEEKEMEAYVKTFIEREIGMKVAPEQIQPIQGGLGKGLSGDRLFKILDPYRRPLFVVKVFMKSRGKFFREFHTLMNHNGLNLKSLNIPKPVGIGASEWEGKRVYFLAMNHVAGTSVYDLFLKMAACKEGSCERGEAFEKLLQVYAKLGQGLAEFHGSGKKGDPLPLHPVFLDLLGAFSRNAFEKFKSHLKPELLEKLRKFFEERLAIESKKGFPRGFFHGDINAGNLIESSVTDRLSLIDWPDASFSVGKGGAPTGLSLYDLVQVKNELLTRQAEGISEKETTQLYQTFIDEYTKCGQPIPSQESLDFFSSLDLMGSLKWFLDKKAIFQPSQLGIAEKIYQAKLTRLEKLIEGTGVPS